MTRTNRRRRFPLLLAAHLMYIGALVLSLPAAAMQILDAADHAELSAEISATGVNRIALSHDRIAKVVRSPDGFTVEHDGASGDLYLRPAGAGPVDGGPVTLFVGTERGFTYRLTLTPVMRDSAQILIRNGGIAAGAGPALPALAGEPRIGVRGEPHVAALVRLVRAVARREPLPGYEIRAGGGTAPAGLTLIETWRGPRLAALVFEAARPASEVADGTWPGHGSGLAGLAGTIGSLPGAGPVAALWLAAPGTGPSGGRLGVAVTGTVPAGEPR